MGVLKDSQSQTSLKKKSRNPFVENRPRQKENEILPIGNNQTCLQDTIYIICTMMLIIVLLILAKDWRKALLSKKTINIQQ